MKYGIKSTYSTKLFYNLSQIDVISYYVLLETDLLFRRHISQQHLKTLKCFPSPCFFSLPRRRNI